MWKKMLKDVFPTMIALTLSGIYGIVDGIFVGRTGGETGLAAINLAWPLPAFITAVGAGIGAGGSVLYSNFRGGGKRTESRCVYQSTLAALIMGGILTTILLTILRDPLLHLFGARGAVLTEAVRYTRIIVLGSLFQILGTGLMPILRNQGMALDAMLGMVVGFFMNITINYILMFRFRMGIQGAAYGTVISQLLVTVLSVLRLIRAGQEKPGIRLDGSMIRRILKTGLTTFGVSLSPTAALVLTNFQCLRYGGETMVACYAAVSYIVFPVQGLLTGIGDGVQPLLSYYYGAEKEGEVRQLRRLAGILAVLLGAATALLSVVCAPYMGGWFGLSGETTGYFRVGMAISATAFPAIGIAKLNVACLNATLRTGMALAMTYLESLVVSPVCLLLFPAALRTKGIWISLPATACVMILIYNLKGRKMNDDKEKY